MEDSQMNRRHFLSASSASGLALAAAGQTAVGQSRGANDVIQVGVIGPGGRGTQLMKECIEVRQ